MAANEIIWFGDSLVTLYHTIPEKMYQYSCSLRLMTASVKKWNKLDEPALAVMVEPQVNKEDIYHKVHVMGADWYVRTMDTMEVMSRA